MLYFEESALHQSSSCRKWGINATIQEHSGGTKTLVVGKDTSNGEPLSSGGATRNIQTTHNAIIDQLPTNRVHLWLPSKRLGNAYHSRLGASIQTHPTHAHIVLSIHMFSWLPQRGMTQRVENEFDATAVSAKWDARAPTSIVQGQLRCSTFYTKNEIKWKNNTVIECRTMPVIMELCKRCFPSHGLEKD